MTSKLNVERFAAELAEEIAARHPQALDFLIREHGDSYSAQEKVLFFYAQLALPEEEEQLFNRVYAEVDTEVFNTHSFQHIIGELAPAIITALKEVTARTAEVTSVTNPRSTAELKALEAAAD